MIYWQWTDEQVSIMLDNRQLSYYELAAMIGCTHGQVRQKFRSMKIRKPRAASSTSYAKGHLPHNTRFNGFISKRRDNRGIDYLFIRIGLKKWTPLQRYVWEQLNGPIPKGYLVVLKDGDTLNCAPDNLMLITRREHVIRNHNRPKAAKSLKKHWDYCRTKEIYGIRTVRHAQLNKKPRITKPVYADHFLKTA